MLKCTMVVRPSWMPNNVHGYVPTQGQADNLFGPVTKRGLGLSDHEHAGRLTDVRGANRRLEDLGQIARMCSYLCSNIL